MMPRHEITQIIQTIPVNSHIVAVSTQECEQPLKKSVFFNPGKQWETLLIQHLTPKFQILQSEVLVGTHLVIFINCSYIDKVAGILLLHLDVKTSRLATGVGNVIGNKGAVGISFLFFEHSFLFTNAHLAGSNLT
jgi:hypothetical protein